MSATYPEPEHIRLALPGPLALTIADRNMLCLQIPADFSERSWAARFGEVQRSLETGNWQELPIASCHIDFSSCEWADPLPLLSLSLALADFEDRGGLVSIKLPEVCGQSARGRERGADGCLERMRLLKFLAREGFLDLLAYKRPATSAGEPNDLTAELRDGQLGGVSMTKDHLRSLKNLWAPLAFEESTCVPARLFSVSRPPEMSEDKNAAQVLARIDEWVERVLSIQILPVVTDKVPAWAHRGLLHRIQTFLRETLHNVAEHAYDSSGLAAVYVRYREGQLGQAPSAWRLLEQHVRREESSRYGALLGATPRYQGFARTRAGFFEIFVLDAGIGLAQRIAADPAQRRVLKVPLALPEAMRLVFSEGYSSKPIRATEHGGLHLLQRLLEPTKDYLRARDDDTWWGRDLPLPISQSESTPMGRFVTDCDAQKHDKPPVHGLAWTARLSWQNRMDRPASPQGNWLGMTDIEQRRPLLATMRAGSPSAAVLKNVPVFDWRLSGGIWSNADGFQPAAADVQLLLPDRDWMKNTVQDRLNQAVGAGCLKPGGMLVLGDIASEEAMTFLAATRKAARLFEGIDPTERPGFVVLVTRDLRVVVLQISGDLRLFSESHQHTANFLAQRAKNDDSRLWHLTDYHRFLRLHDGRRQWEAMGLTGRNAAPQAESRQSSRVPQAAWPIAPFVREWVDWHNGRCLDGYLDFPGTLTNPICRELYSLNLERLTALFPNDDCRLRPLDTLVGSLLTRFRAQQRPRGYKANARQLDIFVGSVQVSGLTEEINCADRERPTVFHFFRHPSGDAKGWYLLPWLAPFRKRAPNACSSPDNRPREFYERVGRTPAIARGGWKAYRMPRFDAQEASIYEAPPSETYRAWQDASRTPLKLGHWSYGGHHDLLTVNLLLAFDTELDQISLAVAGRLGRFIYANLFRVLDIRREHLSLVGQALHQTIANESFGQLLPLRIGSEGALVIYPSHPVTDHVFARMVSWIDDDNKLADVLARCIPILPLRRHRSGSGLQISGLTLERLRTCVRRPEPVDSGAAPSRPAVILDDAMISGRTFLELKSLLHDLGYRDIYCVTMLDRQRLPSASHINRSTGTSPDPADGAPREVRNVCFWRLDAPAMGSPGHCPLCKGLGRVKDLAEYIENRDRRERARRWLELWSERNPATEWGDGGLRPIPLDLAKRTRKFGIVPNENDRTSYRQAKDESQEIVLTNSAGLVAWVTELYSVTSRDDLPIKVLKSEHLPPEVVIQLVASQLLLFHGEYDRALALDLGVILVEALMAATDHDRNTAFAAIALMSCGTRFLAGVMARLAKHSGGNAPVGQDAGGQLLSNLDFYVLLNLCVLLKIDTGPFIAPQYSEDLDRDAISEGDATLHAQVPALRRKEAYLRLDRIVCAGDEQHHSSHLRRLSVELENQGGAVSETLDYFKHAKECATDIKLLMPSINSFWLRDVDGATRSVKQDFRRIRTEVIQQANGLIQQIDEVVGNLRKGTATPVLATDCSDLAEELLEVTNSVFESVYFPLGLQSLKRGEEPDFLQEVKSALIVCQKEKTFDCVPRSAYYYKCAWDLLDKPQKREIYIIWDSDLRNALDRLLSNNKHAQGEPQSCPGDWDPKKLVADRRAHQWVALEIEKGSFCIRLRHLSTQDAEIVWKKTGHKWFVRAFFDVGGSVSYENVGDLLQTTIKIPYAHTLGDEASVENNGRTA